MVLCCVCDGLAIIPCLLYAMLLRLSCLSIGLHCLGATLFTQVHTIPPLKVIDLREKTVTYFDSMQGDNRACHLALREWLVAEAKDKKGMVLDLAGWKSVTPKVRRAFTIQLYISTVHTYDMHNCSCVCVQCTTQCAPYVCRCVSTHHEVDF